MDTVRFIDMREEVNKSKKVLAEELKISPSVYGRWENGKISIPTRRLYQISNYYRINLDYLLCLINDKKTILTDENIDMNLVSKRVREIRGDFGETLRVFSKRFNTTNSTWSAYETGKTLILSDFLIELCEKHRYSADWILGRSDEKFNNKK